MDIARQFVEFVDGRSFHNVNISLCVPTIVCSFFLIVIIIVIIIIVAIWLKLSDCARIRLSAVKAIGGRVALSSNPGTSLDRGEVRIH